MTISTASNVGINMGLLGSPTQRLDVAGKIKIGNDGATPTEGTMRYYATDSLLQFYDGVQWRDAATPWMFSGTKLHYDNGAVLIGRTNTIGSERFGVRYPVSGASYGGMYIENKWQCRFEAILWIRNR